MAAIELSENAARQVYATLGGASTELGEILTQTRRRVASGEALAWSVPVSARTVHRLEGLFLLAKDEKVEVRLLPAQGLTPREQAFLDDFSAHCLPHAGAADGALGRRARFVAELSEELV